MNSGIDRSSLFLFATCSAIAACSGGGSADEGRKVRFVAADTNVPTPNGVAGTHRATLLVSSVLNGVIAEYDLATGSFLRRLLEPPAGEGLGPEPYTTGSPLGIAVDAEGTVYYADLGLVVRNGSIGPEPQAGSIRRLRFDGDQPRAPETLLAPGSFPDGIGVYQP